VFQAAEVGQKPAHACRVVGVGLAMGGIQIGFFLAVPARGVVMMVMLVVRNSGFHVPGLVLFRRIVVVFVVDAFNHDKVLSEKVMR
jgi:hypothetical protein